MVSALVARVVDPGHDDFVLERAVRGIHRGRRQQLAAAGVGRRIGLGGVGLAGRQSGPSSVEMARIAIAFAFEQVVARHLVRGQRRAPFQEGVELRRERTDVVRAFEEGDGLPPVVVDPVRPGAVFRTQANWLHVRTEPRRPSRGAADLLGVSREVDVERPLPPDVLEELPVLGLGKLECDAGRVGVAHFQGVDRRMLGLLRVRALQQVPGRAPVPEVSAEE